MKRLLTILICLSVTAFSAYAGNPDRSGESGAYELTINSWARSSGMFGMNTARVMGVESMRLNPAGLAFTRKTEIVAAYTLWLQGSETNISHAGFAQKLGEDNVLGLSIQSMSFGEIPITTTENPEGNIGTFEPRFSNIGVAYARTFSNSIYAGTVVRVVNESIADINASAVSFDAGIQYVTGKNGNLRLGVAIRNIGTNMKYQGDGFTFRGQAPDGDFNMTQLQRSEKFNLPSLLNLGLSYDFYLGGGSGSSSEEGAEEASEEEVEDDGVTNHRLTVVGNFTSNSVGKDFFGGGVEYAFKEMFMARFGYRYEQDILDSELSTTVYTGIAAGVSFDLPVRTGGPNFGIDYSFRQTRVWDGTHTLGIRINL